MTTKKPATLTKRVETLEHARAEDQKAIAYIRSHTASAVELTQIRGDVEDLIERIEKTDDRVGKNAERTAVDTTGLADAVHKIRRDFEALTKRISE